MTWIHLQLFIPTHFLAAYGSKCVAGSTNCVMCSTPSRYRVRYVQGIGSEMHAASDSHVRGVTRIVKYFVQNESIGSIFDAMYHRECPALQFVRRRILQRRTFTPAKHKTSTFPLSSQHVWIQYSGKAKNSERNTQHGGSRVPLSAP